MTRSAMKAATPQDTFDHIIGSGALTFEWWWQAEPVKGVTNGEPGDDWEYRVTADNGDEGLASELVNHAVVMKAVRKIAADKGGIAYLSEATRRQARNLIFNASDADLDAAVADEVLQFIVLGEIVFG